MLDMGLYSSKYILYASHEIRGPDNITGVRLLQPDKNKTCIKSSLPKCYFTAIFTLKILSAFI